MNERERTVWEALREYILSDGRAQWHLVSGLDDLLDGVTESTTDDEECGGFYTEDDERITKLAEENKRLAKALLLIETNDPHDFDEEDWKYYDAAVMIAREALKEDQ